MTTTSVPLRWRIATIAVLSFLASSGRCLAITNDECDGAIVLPVGSGCASVSGDWTDATQSYSATPCEGGTSISAHDVWFTFMAGAEHTIIEVQSGSGNDAVVEVLGGSCSGLFPIACADATLSGGLETLTLNTTPGWSYFVRTYWWDYGSAPLDLGFTICAYIGPPSPVNDACASATPDVLLPGGSLIYSGTTSGADTIGDYTEGSLWQGAAPSIWHSFSLDECAYVTIRYCGTSPAFESVWTVLSTHCPADTMIFADEFDLVSCGDANTTVVFDSLAAGTYYLPVLSDGDLANGPYTITVSASNCSVGLEEAELAQGRVSVDPDGGLTIHLPDDPSRSGSAEWFAVDGRVVEVQTIWRASDGMFHAHRTSSTSDRIEAFRFTTVNGTGVRSLVTAQ